VLRYLLVGGSGYVLAMGLYSALIALDVSPYAALPPVFVLNGLYNFTLARVWAFPASGRPLRQELLRFCAVAVVSLLANYSFLYLLHDGLGVPAIPAQALAIALSVPVGFLGNKLYSFGPVRSEAAG
jgi:putative flippase GtrA